MSTKTKGDEDAASGTAPPPCQNSENGEVHPFAKYLPKLDAAKFPKIHPLANLFPMLNAEDMEAFAETIRLNGLQKPIELDANGNVVEGRNRYVGCLLKKVQPVTIVRDDLT